jgi:hypothetical protein
VSDAELVLANLIKSGASTAESVSVSDETDGLVVLKALLERGVTAEDLEELVVEADATGLQPDADFATVLRSYLSEVVYAPDELVANSDRARFQLVLIEAGVADVVVEEGQTVGDALKALEKEAGWTVSSKKKARPMIEYAKSLFGLND